MKDRNLNNVDDWATPSYFYDKLNEEFNFDFDPCPINHNIDDWDGLEVEWGKRNYINPPYSLKLKTAFVDKAIAEKDKGNLCVMLLPVSTSTVLFHDKIFPNAKEIRIVKTRIKFEGVNTFGEKVNDKAGMHDSMVVILGDPDGPVKLTTMNSKI